MIKQPTNTQSQYLGKEGEDPSSPFWGHGNYVGPYWSNGVQQSSVEWGNKEPIDALDALARQHDSAYAKFSDRPHREAADAIFAQEARKLTQVYGKGWAADPKVAAALVQYGNYTQRQIKQLGEYTNYGTKGMVGNIIGAVRFGVGNLLNAGKMVNGTYLKQEKDDIEKYFQTDPKRTGGGGLPIIVKGVVDRPLTKKTGPSAGTPKKGNKVQPAVETKPDVTNHTNLIKNQAQRFRDYSALHAAAVASTGRPRVWKKRTKKNLNAALPASYLLRKRNAVRPA